MDIGGVLLLASFGAVAWYLLKPKASKKPMHCMSCGADSHPTVAAKGSTGIELILWICFIVPGLIYSIWRLSNKGMKCPTCGSENLIPLESPAAIKHKKDLAA